MKKKSKKFRWFLTSKNKVWFWHFLTNCHSSTEFFNFFSFELVDSWPKILLFRTHHLWNSTTELILMKSKETSCEKSAPSESISTHYGILHVMWSIFEYKVFYEIGLWVNLLVKSIKNVHPLHTVSFSQLWLSIIPFYV